MWRPSRLTHARVSDRTSARPPISVRHNSASEWFEGLAAEGDGRHALWSVEEGRQRVDRLNHGAVDAFQSGGELLRQPSSTGGELWETMLPAMKRSFEHQRARARDRISRIAIARGATSAVLLVVPSASAEFAFYRPRPGAASHRF